MSEKPTLPVHPDNIHKELEHVTEMLTKWRDSVSNGIVGIDIPAADADEKLDAFLREFTGELLFVSGKCQNLAMVLTER